VQLLPSEQHWSFLNQLAQLQIKLISLLHYVY